MTFKNLLLFSGLFLAACSTALASYQDVTGATLLFATTTNLNGSGIRIGQAEAELTANGSDWEVTPSIVGRTNGYFTYYSTNTSSTTFPNSLGTDSFHADEVATNLYGLPGGIATGIPHVDNFEGNYFVNTTVRFLQSINGDRLVNQSFTFGAQTVSTQQTYDSYFDNFAIQYKTLFVSGAGNGGTVALPATSYNGIGVGAYGGGTAVGPTSDNGRAKPDLTAPADATSFSTPQVTGAAALLLQAGLRGDAGTDTNSASDDRTVKALLLNGALKPAAWSAPSPSPLDTLYGAGVMNIFNSYHQFIGGKHTNTISTNINAGTSHASFATTNSAVITNLSGWDFATVTSSARDAVNEYHFTLPNNSTNTGNAGGNATYAATITLVWHRQQNFSAINNLYLYLYKLGSTNPVGVCTSTVDNVQHIYLRNIPTGQYALQVFKPGGVPPVSFAETYALAYEFFNLKLSIIRTTNGNVQLTWPIYPTGFVLEYTADVTSGSWNTLNATPVILSNSVNQITLTPSVGVSQYYRLRRP